MTQNKRLTGSTIHEPQQMQQIVSEYDQEITQSQASDKPMAP